MKATIFFLWLLVISMLFPGLLPAEELSQSELEYLQEKGEIIFVSQTRYPPFEFIGPSGQHTGMCIELVRWMATELEFKARFVDASFNKAQEDILAGRADVLTGSETFYKLRELKPDLPVILCTGYSHNSIIEKLLSSGAGDFIQKPFKLKVLTAKIRRIFA